MLLHVNWHIPPEVSKDHCGDTYIAALLPMSVQQATHRPSKQQLNHHSKPLSHSLLLCLLPRTRKWPPASILHVTSHAYQLCQPTNDRADWRADEQNKRSPFGPTRLIHSERNNGQHTSRKDSSRQKTRRLTAQPCSLMDQAHHRSFGTFSSSPSAPVPATSIPPWTSSQPTA